MASPKEIVTNVLETCQIIRPQKVKALANMESGSAKTQWLNVARYYSRSCNQAQILNRTLRVNKNKNISTKNIHPQWMQEIAEQVEATPVAPGGGRRTKRSKRTKTMRKRK